MQSYTVHEESQPAADRADRAERLVFVRDGFSWGAALFAPLWLLLHRLWLGLLAYIALVVALQLLGTTLKLDQRWLGLASLGLNLLLGFEADNVRRWALRRRGWTTLGAVTGPNLTECERRFFDDWLQAQPIIAPPAGRAATPASATRGWLGFGGLLGARS